MTADLASSLERLRKTTNRNCRSEDTTATPLWVYLYIYSCSEHECYRDYMEGARRLYKYLAPITTPIPLEVVSPIPKLLVSYELVELAKILFPQDRNKGLTAIYLTMVNIVLPKLRERNQP